MQAATTKGGVTQFTFDASATGGVGPNGDIQSITTSQSSKIGLQPGNGSGSNAGTDAYQYDSLGKMLADTRGRQHDIHVRR